MLWPLEPAACCVVAFFTVCAALCADANARRMRILLHGAVMSNNSAAIDATQRRIQRSRNRLLTFALPTVLVGMSLLITQATAYIVTALRFH